MLEFPHWDWEMEVQFQLRQTKLANAFLLDTQCWDYVDFGRVGFDRSMILTHGTTVGHRSLRV